MLKRPVHNLERRTCVLILEFGFARMVKVNDITNWLRLDYYYGRLVTRVGNRTHLLVDSVFSSVCKVRIIRTLNDYVISSKMTKAFGCCRPKRSSRVTKAKTFGRHRLVGVRLAGRVVFRRPTICGRSLEISGRRGRKKGRRAAGARIIRSASHSADRGSENRVREITRTDTAGRAIIVA